MRDGLELLSSPRAGPRDSRRVAGATGLRRRELAAFRLCFLWPRLSIVWRTWKLLRFLATMLCSRSLRDGCRTWDPRRLRKLGRRWGWLLPILRRRCCGWRLAVPCCGGSLLALARWRGGPRPTTPANTAPTDRR